MSLMSKMMKSGKIKGSILSDSKYLKNIERVPMPVPILNVIFSGSLTRGFKSGVYIWAGPSKHFKSMYTLLMVAAYLKLHPDAIAIFYDNEFGAAFEYFDSAGIDKDRVLHIPFKTLEELRADMTQKLDDIDDAKGEKVIIFVDSVGNAASKKEVNDALTDNEAMDMTRAKTMKSFFRIITPYTTIKNIPIIGIAHTYDEQKMHGKKIVSGGCVTAGTLVKLENGVFKAIEEIQVGDVVDTPIGPNTVTHTWTPETLTFGNPECFEIEFDDGAILTISENDHLFKDGQLVKVKDIQANDYVDYLV